MNKKYYIKLMSANLFEEKKLSNKDQKENPLVQMINAAEEDNNARNINNHEKQNESKDKSSETGHPNNQSDGGTLNINININNSDNLILYLVTLIKKKVYLETVTLIIILIIVYLIYLIIIKKIHYLKEQK